MKAMIFYTVMPPEYEKKMEHMVGEQLLREALREEYGIRLEYEARSVGSTASLLSAAGPRYTIISAIQGNMWSVLWHLRRWELTFRFTVRIRISRES